MPLTEDAEALAQETRLDGCYVLKSDVPKTVDKHILHDRYLDLATVEQAFRTCKTTMLEIRPWYVWTDKSTRGHALVVMLAYLITRYLQQAWAAFDLTVEEGLKQLSTLCSMEIGIKDQSSCHRIPTPRPPLAQLLSVENSYHHAVETIEGTSIQPCQALGIKVEHPYEKSLLQFQSMSYSFLRGHQKMFDRLKAKGSRFRHCNDFSAMIA